jgi:threonine dehydrogenase-like Zn-dependent dehydrogenase
MTRPSDGKSIRDRTTKLPLPEEKENRMKANCWYGKGDVQIVDVSEPEILNSRDAVIKVTSTAICGSDLHLYNGLVPTMEKGDILGHEFMGEVVEVGNEIHSVKAGDRVVASFPISCGNCFFCQKELFSLCENSNPNAWMAQQLFGHSPAGIYGYTHMLGGFAGGQAEYARVPFADVGTVKIPDGLSDEQVLFLSDIFPTGYMAAENCNIQPGDTIAVWGCGPVGQLAMKSAYCSEPSASSALIDFPIACKSHVKKSERRC